MSNTATINERFLNAWKEVGNPELDGFNPHFKNRYASLAATLQVIRSACVKNEIAYIQTLTTTENNAVISSYVIDGQGNRLSLSTFPVEVVPNPQSFGSNLTYIKRQQAQADWVIVGDEDDDAEAAAAAPRQRATTTQTSSQNQQAQQPPRQDNLATLRQLFAEAKEVGIKIQDPDEPTAGLMGWVTATYARPVNELTPEEIERTENYVRDRIADARSLKSKGGNQ